MDTNTKTWSKSTKNVDWLEINIVLLTVNIFRKLTHDFKLNGRISRS